MNKPQSQWDYAVRGYAGAKHATAKYGELILETVHQGERSKDLEIDVWMERMKRGEVSRLEVEDLKALRP